MSRTPLPRNPRSRTSHLVARVSLLAVLGLSLVASSVFAQGQIGFAQKAEDQERKWIDGLAPVDLENLSLMRLVFTPEKVTVTDGRWSESQGQRIAILNIDFGDAELDLSKTPASSIDEETKIRTLEADLPKFRDDDIDRLRVEFLVQEDGGDTDDKRIKCRLDNALPVTEGSVALYILEGIERSFWCRDIRPSAGGE